MIRAILMARPTAGLWRQGLKGLGGWALVVGVFILQGAVGRIVTEQPVALERLVRSELTVFLPWVVLTPVLAVLTRRFPLLGPRRGLHLLIHLAAGCVCSLAHVALAVGTGLAPRGTQPWGVHYAHMASRTLGSHLLLYGAIVAVQHAAAAWQAFRERELQSVRLEAQLAQAQLAVLRTQLHPHFLFNTLHAVSALMSRDVSAARRTLSRLSELLRQSLDTESEPEVPLREELLFLDHYLEIQRLRFGERLAVLQRIAPEALEGAVPRLLLQPLVENAIRHGLEPRAEGGTLEVRAERSGERLLLTVLDDGTGLPPGLTAPARQGVGLRHTGARLRALYGEAHRFEFHPRPGGGVVVQLELPWRTLSMEPGTRGGMHGAHPNAHRG